MIKQLINLFNFSKDEDDMYTTDDHVEYDDELGEFLEEKNKAYK
ncbi:hypothetical protein [Niallia sp. 01092]